MHSKPVKTGESGGMFPDKITQTYLNPVGRLCQPFYYSPPRISDLPVALYRWKDLHLKARNPTMLSTIYIAALSSRRLTPFILNKLAPRITTRQWQHFLKHTGQ